MKMRLGIAVLASVGLAMSGCRETGSGVPGSPGRVWELRAAQSQLYQAGTMADALGQIDSLLATALETRSVILAGFDSIAAPEFEQLVDEAGVLWARAGGPSSGGRLALVRYQPRFAVPDTSRGIWTAFSGTLLPGRVDGRTCVAVVPGARLSRGGTRPGVTRGWLESLLAPCLYVARFGQPGRGMADWLERTDYDGIRSSGWLVRSHAPIVNEYWWFDDVPDGVAPWRAALAPLTALATGAARHMPPYEQGLAAVGCLAGRDQDCARMLFEDVQLAPHAVAASDIVSRRRSRNFGPVAMGLFGRAHWTSELIRLHGPDRFAALWQSAEPLPASYRRIYGEDPGGAARAWAATDWVVRRERPEVRLGPTVGAVSFASTAVWMLLFLLLPVAGAAGRSSRRQ